MIELPFDLADPPDEPPVSVVQPMLWRLAVRLYRDHCPPVPGSVPGQAGRNTAGQRSATCRICGAPWPCPGRRIAERGLISALREPRTGRGAASFADWFLGADHDPMFRGDSM